MTRFPHRTIVPGAAGLAVALASGLAGTAATQSEGSQTFTLDQAAYLSPIAGTSGGNPFVLACPAGQVMVGVTGKRVAPVMTVGPLCSLTPVDSVVGFPHATSAAGTGTGFPYTLLCGSQQVMVGLELTYTSWVDVVRIYCRPWANQRWSGAETAVGPAGKTMLSASPTTRTYRCTRAEQPVVALRGRASVRVNALGITCDEPNGATMISAPPK